MLEDPKFSPSLVERHKIAHIYLSHFTPSNPHVLLANGGDTSTKSIVADGRLNAYCDGLVARQSVSVIDDFQSLMGKEPVRVVSYSNGF